MWKIVLPVICVVTGVAGLFLGIALGALLGRIGSLEVISFILRIPVILIKSPKEFGSKWKIWQELRDIRRIERIKRIKEINTLKDEIEGHKGQVKKIKVKIRRVMWEFRKPKEK
ncbi:MAG: hypothetical protein HQ594_03765 [Candidatus Omnitrophica bacterium]|nr:hypothetical protein [Candidatus Omnitrophota bacterium]